MKEYNNIQENESISKSHTNKCKSISIQEHKRDTHNKNNTKKNLNPLIKIKGLEYLQENTNKRIINNMLIGNSFNPLLLKKVVKSINLSDRHKPLMRYHKKNFIQRVVSQIVIFENRATLRQLNKRGINTYTPKTNKKKISVYVCLVMLLLLTPFTNWLIVFLNRMFNFNFNIIIRGDK